MRSFIISMLCIASFFLCLELFFSPSTIFAPDNQSGPSVSNVMQTQKQAEAIQKNVVIQKQRPGITRQDSFSQYVSQAFQQLPSESDARISAEKNPHDTPEAVMKAGATIGYVADQMKANPRNIETGLKFFKGCAQSENVVSTIRAVCLRNLVDFSSRYRNNVRVSFADYPEDIQRIARHIPRLR